MRGSECPAFLTVIVMKILGQPSQAVCYENIGPRERAHRARFGYLALAFGVALAVVLVLSGAERAWRLLVFFPIAGGVTSWLQARERT